MVSEERLEITFVLEVIAGPPATGVAETVKLSGAAPQLVQPTVRVAEVSRTEIAEMVANGFGVVTFSVAAGLVSPPWATVTEITCATFGSKLLKLRVAVPVVVSVSVVAEPPAGVIDAT